MVLQIQTDKTPYVLVPEGVLRFTHKLMDRTHSVLADMTSILVPYDGLYGIELSGGRYKGGFHISLNINGLQSKDFEILDGFLYHNHMSTVMQLSYGDLIKLDNLSSSRSFALDPTVEFSLILTRLA